MPVRVAQFYTGKYPAKIGLSFYGQASPKRINIFYPLKEASTV